MHRFKVGERVRIISAIPGFHLQLGTIAGIADPIVANESSREDALREMRLYAVRLEDGRRFRFRGKELDAPMGQA
jgi:hypothetical protein